LTVLGGFPACKTIESSSAPRACCPSSNLRVSLGPRLPQLDPMALWIHDPCEAARLFLDDA
jgi:hypothetical protein